MLEAYIVGYILKWNVYPAALKTQDSTKRVLQQSCRSIRGLQTRALMPLTALTTLRAPDAPSEPLVNKKL